MPIHFPELIPHFGGAERVLEIGPGAHPWPRADVLCDRFDRDDPEALAQDGFDRRPEYAQPVVVYDAPTLPFRDRSFDFVICSHVLEHVDPAEVSGFLTELPRVAPAGYLEFPRFTLEMQGDVAVHRWMLNVVDDEIRMLPKERLSGEVEAASDTLGWLLSELTESSPGYQDVYGRYLPLWVCGMVWQGAPRWRQVASLSELLSPDEDRRTIQRIAAQERADGTFRRRLARRLGRTATPAAPPPESRSGRPSWFLEVVRCWGCATGRCEATSNGCECKVCGARYAWTGNRLRRVTDAHSR